MNDGIKHGVFETPEPAQHLTVYIGESNKWHGQPLYEAIVLKARELHLAGATVLRGPMGFGANSCVHTVKILRLSEDLPILIEIVDSKASFDTLLPHIDQMVQEGLVTLEDAAVIKYRAGKPVPKRSRMCMTARSREISRM